MENKTEFDDNDLRRLFADFNPPLRSDADFLSRLQAGMNAVESARVELAAMRRNNRRAVFIAAFAGFLVGILVTLVMPHLLSFAASLTASLPAGTFANALADNLTLIAWLLTAATVIFTSLNTYDISLRLLSLRRNSES